MTSAQQMRVGAGGIPPPPSPGARALSIVERTRVLDEAELTGAVAQLWGEVLT